MEENKIKTGKFSLQFGVIAGLIGVVFGVMLYSMELHYEQTWVTTLVDFLIITTFTIIAVSQFKKANGGLLSLKEGLKIGTGVGLIFGILSILYFAILTNVIEPDYMDKVNEISRVKAFEANPKLTQEQWDQGMEMQKKFFWLGYPVYLIWYAILGLIAGLIGGLSLKKS